MGCESDFQKNWKLLRIQERSGLALEIRVKSDVRMFPPKPPSHDALHLHQFVARTLLPGCHIVITFVR
jgi:hypothetical protein